METSPTLEMPANMQPAMWNALREYAALIQELADENLLGLTVFGPVLGRRFDQSQMAAGSVMVLRQMDLPLLRRLAERGRALGAKRIAAPLAMTSEYIKGSCDSFPLELLEIAQRHITLCGQDCFNDLEIADEHLRLQCERELKRILMRLRQGLLAAGTREDFLGALEADIGVHVLRTLRGLLWLRGQKEFVEREAVLTEAEKIADGKLPGVRSAVNLTSEYNWAEFQSLYHDVEKLAKVADEL